MVWGRCAIEPGGAVLRPLPIDPVGATPLLEARSFATLPTCPSCGQRVDKANIRCPRCRRWFTEPPVRRKWNRLTIAAAMVGLVIAGFVAGVAVDWFWLPLPPGVVVPEEPVDN